MNLQKSSFTRFRKHLESYRIDSLINIKKKCLVSHSSVESSMLQAILSKMDWNTYQIFYLFMMKYWI